MNFKDTVMYLASQHSEKKRIIFAERNSFSLVSRSFAWLSTRLISLVFLNFRGIRALKSDHIDVEIVLKESASQCCKKVARHFEVHDDDKH